MKSKKNGKSTTSGPTSLLQKNHLTPAAGTVVDNHKQQRHTKKLISPEMKTGEKTKLPFGRTSQHILPSTPRCLPEGHRRCGRRVEADLFAWTSLLPSQRHAKEDKT
jgi:hypothetical protein